LISSYIVPDVLDVAPTCFTSSDTTSTRFISSHNTSQIHFTSPTHITSPHITPDIPDVTQDDESDSSSNNPSESLELVSGLTFTSWDEFKNYLDMFALKEGFDYKIRTSEKD